MIKLILAMDPNGIIGKNNSLPWRDSKELKHFKETTMGASLIMGRKTFESLPGILPGREHYVISSGTDFDKVNNIRTDEQIKDIFNYYKESDKDLYIAGGKTIYEQFANEASELIITVMNDEYDGDTKIDLDLDSYNKELIKETNTFKVYKYKK